jgi:hypothetical protein
MTSPESSSHSYDALDRELHALLLDDERLQAHLDTPYSLDETKQFLLESLASHLEALGDYDASDEEELRIVADTVLEAVQADFLQQETLFYGDEILAYGDSIAIMTDPYQEAPLGFRALLLSNAAKIRGSFKRLVIIETPQQQHVAELHNSSADVTSCEVQYDEFGLSFLLTDVVYLDEDGVATQIMPPNIVFVPLQYSGLKLDRFIRPIAE